MNYYNTLRTLLVVLIILNILDGITTVVGVFFVGGLSEGNPLILQFLHNMWLFLAFKVGLLCLLLVFALVYLLHLHHAFAKLWENEVGVGAALVVTALYVLILVNNIGLLL